MYHPWLPSLITIALLSLPFLPFFLPFSLGCHQLPVNINLPIVVAISIVAHKSRLHFSRNNRRPCSSSDSRYRCTSKEGDKLNAGSSRVADRPNCQTNVRRHRRARGGRGVNSTRTMRPITQNAPLRRGWNNGVILFNSMPYKRNCLQEVRLLFSPSAAIADQSDLSFPRSRNYSARICNLLFSIKHRQRCIVLSRGHLIRYGMAVICVRRHARSYRSRGWRGACERSNYRSSFQYSGLIGPYPALDDNFRKRTRGIKWLSHNC